MNSILSGNGDYIHMEVPDIRRAFEALEADINNPFTQRTLIDILKKMGFPKEILPEHAPYKMRLAWLAKHILSLQELNILDHATISILLSMLAREEYTDLQTFDKLSEMAKRLHSIVSAARSSGNVTPGDFNFMDFNRYTVENIGGIH